MKFIFKKGRSLSWVVFLDWVYLHLRGSPFSLMKHFVTSILIILLCTTFCDTSSKDKTVKTGLYLISSAENGSIMLDKTNISFNIGKKLAGVEDIFSLYFCLTCDVEGYSILRLDLQFRGKVYRRIIRQIDGRKNYLLGLIIDNKLVDTVNAAQIIPRGDYFGIYRNVYSVQELKKISDFLYAELRKAGIVSIPNSAEDIRGLLLKVDTSRTHIIY